MHYAAKGTDIRSAEADIAGHLADLDALAREATAAGDAELARAVEAHAVCVRRLPETGAGAVTLLLASGRRVPLRDARRHIRRAGRPTSTGGGSALLRDIERASASCRALASAADQAKIASVLAGDNRTAEPAGVCPFCCTAPDAFGGCWC